MIRRQSFMYQDVRRLVEMAWQLARGNYSNIIDFYAASPKRGVLFLVSASYALAGAVGSGNERLFDRVRNDLQNLLKETSDSLPADDLSFGAQLVECWLRLHLRVKGGEPGWLKDFDFANVPPSWRFLVGFLKVLECRNNGDVKTAYVIVKMLLELFPRRPGGLVVRTYLLRTCAEICRDLGRNEESFFWFGKLARLSGRRRFLYPYLSLLMGPKTPAEVSLREQSPEMAHKVTRLSDGYLRNVVSFHNRLTAGHVTNELTTREFYIAEALKMGLSYKDIARNMSISLGRVNIMVRIVYEKLDIHCRKELETIVW